MSVNMATENLITADEVAKMFKLSISTFYRQLKHGIPKIRNRGNAIDVRLVKDTWIGGKRFWLRDSAEALLLSARQ